MEIALFLPILMAKMMQQYGDETLRNSCSSLSLHFYSFVIHPQLPTVNIRIPSFFHPTFPVLPPIFPHRYPFHASSVGCHRGSSSRTGWCVSSNAHGVYGSQKPHQPLTLHQCGEAEGQADGGLGCCVFSFGVYLCVALGRVLTFVKPQKKKSQVFDTVLLFWNSLVFGRFYLIWVFPKIGVPPNHPF